MNNYVNAGEGLRNMFISMVGTIICVIISIVPVVGIVGGIGIIVCSVISLVGLYRIGKDIKACRIAFILRMISVVVTILANFVSIMKVVELVTDLLPFVSEILLLVSVSKVMRERGATDVAKLGKWTLCFTIASTVGTTVYDILFMVLAFAGLDGMMVPILLGSLVLLGIVITTFVFYWKFLLNSAEQFGAYV